ncbi:MAG: hypothetical protein JWO01_212 [Microbacteriaceae bacterium]|nr:hypothetical protein [Microbacteriaceae bacterium]
MPVGFHRCCRIQQVPQITNGTEPRRSNASGHGPGAVVSGVGVVEEAAACARRSGGASGAKTESRKSPAHSSAGCSIVNRAAAMRCAVQAHRRPRTRPSLRRRRRGQADGCGMVAGEQQREHRPERECCDRGAISPRVVTNPDAASAQSASLHLRGTSSEPPRPGASQARVLECTVEEHERGPAPATPVRDAHPADHDLGHSARVRPGLGPCRRWLIRRV